MIAAHTGHVNCHETGAIEATGHKVCVETSPDGKVTPAMVEAVLARHDGTEHMVSPKMVYISDTTEIGTVYTKAELTALRHCCDEYGLLLFLDGARLGSALTSPESDLTLADLAALTDVFTIGGTKNGELFVLDMGRPVKIIELAENMIRLSGYEPYRDIEIVETGLRPGEKLYEELLIANRDLEKTGNGMIFVEHQPPVTPEELERKLTLLNDALEKTMRTEDVSCIRDVLHRVVPTFHEPEEVNRTQGDTVKIPEQEGACS